MTEPKEIVYKLVQNSIGTISNQEAYIAELEMKYKKLLEFVEEISESEIYAIQMFGEDWIRRSKELLKEIGELE